MSEVSGLDQLDRRVKAASSAATQRSRRYVPAPKHPKVPAKQQAGAPAGDEPVAVKPAAESSVADLHKPEIAAASSASADPQPIDRDQTGVEVSTAAPRRRGRVRPTQVHLDEASEEHLSTLKKQAVVADIPLTSSAVLRMALAELVERHGYDRIVQMFADDANQPRPGRPRLRPQ